MFSDNNNSDNGEIRCLYNGSPSLPTVTGCKNLRIVDLTQARGSITPPAVPASGTAFALIYRDSVYTFTGGTTTGTAYTVDGVATGQVSQTFAQQVFVPAGKTISVAYSSVPTLNSVFVL
jgi:hypothetical protein